MYGSDWTRVPIHFLSVYCVPGTLPRPGEVALMNEDGSLTPDTPILRVRGILVLPPASKWEQEKTQ